MSARGSSFFIVLGTADGLICDQSGKAADWVDYQARTGAELFLGMNPRAREEKDKDAVETVTRYYVDLDLIDGDTP